MKISLISIVPGIHNYGPRSISACLKQAGHDVELFFLMKEFHKKYLETAMNNLVKSTKRSDSGKGKLGQLVKLLSLLPTKHICAN
tara:strand:- start:185 stop:439 length:255 start_codon:yes stop_codon:yes gene_type:complete